MPSKATIIEALLFSHFNTAGAINTTGDPAFTITYSFDATAPGNDFSDLDGWRAWSAAEKNTVLAAFAHLETFLNIDFVAAPSGQDADLSLGMVSLPGSTAGLGGAALGFINGQVSSYQSFATWDKTLDITTDLNLVLHELGHALGLDHPFEDVTLPASYENNHYSVMSYSADPHSGEHNDAMMVFDLLALQSVWGAASYNAGATRYNGPRTGNVDTIWDSGGIDTLDAGAERNTVRLDLREGQFSTFGDFPDLAIAYGAKIENAFGGKGADTILGNALANILSGRNGADLLVGDGGRDKLWGGNGADRLKGGNGHDRLGGSKGDDRLWGGNGNDRIEGGAGNDRVWGNAGADEFLFRDGNARDVVKDFQNNIDTLKVIDKGTRAEVLAAASQKDGDVFFRFDDGDVLIVNNMTLNALKDDLVVI